MNIKKLRSFLNNLGIPPHLKGYDYIIDMIEIITDHDKESGRKIKIGELYNRVAEMHETTPRIVERSLRYVKGRIKHPDYIGIDIDVYTEGITNSEFIYRVYTYYK